MRSTRWAAGLALLLGMAGCQDNPLLVDPDTILVAELTLSDGHVHTLSELGLSAVIRNADGEAMTDFEAVWLERRLGDDPWRRVDLALNGVAWEGSYTFASSGDYALRLMVQRHGAVEGTPVPFHDHEMGVMSVGRAHVNVGAYRVEFESFPGHLHEGDEAAMRFWVLTQERDASGARHPVMGLEARILCIPAEGTVEEHVPHHEDGGVYEAHHTFAGDGAFTAAFVLPPDGSGPPLRAEFQFNVAHKH